MATQNYDDAMAEYVATRDRLALLTDEKLLADYRACRESVTAAFGQFGSVSKEYSIALAESIDLESAVIRRGLARTAGITFANVWD